MKQGDIFWASLDPAIGHEQQGLLPVLVVSSSRLNAATKLPVVVPITNGGNFARALGMSVPLTGGGTKTTGIVRCNQPRVLDVNARGGRFIEALPISLLEEVLAKVRSVFD